MVNVENAASGQSKHPLPSTSHRRKKLRWTDYENASDALHATSERTLRACGEAANRRIARPNAYVAPLPDRPEGLLHHQPGYGVVRIRAYASDRIVMAATPEPVAPGKRKHQRDHARGNCPGVLRLDKRRETRRGIEIGNRLRFPPRETRFTQHGRNFVKDGAHLIERHGKGKAVFATLTFPSVTAQSMEIYRHASAYLIDRINRWIRYRVSDGLFLYVWERTKRGTPHLHLMFKTSGTSSISRISEELQIEWRSILLDVCEQTTCDLFERPGGRTWIGDRRKPFVNCRPVSAGLGQYLGKYLSKGRSKDSSQGAWYPGLWWGVSKPLRKLVSQSRLHVRIWTDTEETARKHVADSIRLAPNVLTEPFVCDPVRTHGTLVICLNTPVGASVRVAEALAVYFEHGDLTALSNIVVEFSVPLNKPPPHNAEEEIYGMLQQAS